MTPRLAPSLRPGRGQPRRTARAGLVGLVAGPVLLAAVLCGLTTAPAVAAHAAVVPAAPAAPPRAHTEPPGPPGLLAPPGPRAAPAERAPGPLGVADPPRAPGPPLAPGAHRGHRPPGAAASRTAPARPRASRATAAADHRPAGVTASPHPSSGTLHQAAEPAARHPHRAPAGADSAHVPRTPEASGPAPGRVALPSAPAPTTAPFVARVLPLGAGLVLVGLGLGFLGVHFRHA